MGILDSIRGKADELDKTYNPLRKVADVLGNAADKANADPTGQKAAIARGEAARQEAIIRGRGIESDKPLDVNADTGASPGGPQMVNKSITKMPFENEK